MSDKNEKIGFWTTSALVVGNMIGSGVFLTPSALAAYGPISVIGWFFSGLGALSLAFVFSQLSKLLPIHMVGLMLTQELDWETSQDFWWHGDIGSVFGVRMLQS